MHPLAIEELPYHLDSAPLFATLLDMELPILLDSAAPYSDRGRYDIFSAQPVKIIKSTDHIANTSEKNTFFDEVKTAIQQHCHSCDNDYHLPFIGGAIGSFGYDLARQLENLPSTASARLNAADGVAGIYNWAVIVDHRQHRSVLIAQPDANKALLQDVKSRLTRPDNNPSSSQVDFTLNSEFESNFSHQDYQQAFEQIQRYIQAGDCYQINLAQCFSAHYQGSPWLAYLRLRETAAAPFSAFVGDDNNSILSVSPERFLSLSQNRVSTSPIKGTMARSSDPAEDQQLARQLLNSAKDRAENLMIVDLLRNDLGKSCQPGSIKVDELFELQSFDTVHHLVSTISGQLTAGKTATELLASCFPGGSITGAPKVRAMEIIEELEPHRRSAYCGAIGYISADGQMDTNIAIRTMICEDDKIHCWAGGGIIADSECESEYQECLTKVGKLMAAL
ncbi:MAG: para-aminobenzoate synthetase component 1 [Oceanicoccus sp.]|jgi:para-aminobenzoate synthetase component 1